jgi:hypothetical protein
MRVGRAEAIVSQQLLHGQIKLQLRQKMYGHCCTTSDDAQ